MDHKRRIAGIAMAGAMSLGLVAAPAGAAGTKQDGLVNVNVGNVTILQDVNVAAVVDVVAQLCGIDVTVPVNVAILGAAAQRVDDASRNYTVCKNEGGKVKITQN